VGNRAWRIGHGMERSHTTPHEQTYLDIYDIIRFSEELFGRSSWAGERVVAWENFHYGGREGRKEASKERETLTYLRIK